MTIPGIYSQRDGRWATTLLGYNDSLPYTIGNYGCLITAVANLCWYTGNPGANPGFVNQWLKDRNGFEVGNGLMKWEVANQLLSESQVVAHGYTTDLNAVNNFLQADPNFAIAHLTKPSFPMHWSVMPYVGQIADSWDGQLKSVGAYTFVGAYLYSKVTPEVPAPTPPPLQTPPPPTVPTPVLPEPVEVPTNTEPQSDPNPAPIPVKVDPTVAVTLDPQEVADSIKQHINPTSPYQSALDHFLSWLWKLLIGK